jgi:probable addiction module antidote protein
MPKRKNRLGIAPFDASEYLDNEEVIAEYLAAALEDRNPDVFLHAVADVAKARGVSKVAKDAGLGRESLYKALAPGAKIRYDTVRKLLDSLGVRLTVIPGWNRLFEDRLEISDARMRGTMALGLVIQQAESGHERNFIT